MPQIIKQNVTTAGGGLLTPSYAGEAAEKA